MQETLRVFPEGLRFVPQKFEPVCQHIVEIHHVERFLPLAVAAGDVDDVLQEMTEMRVFQPNDILERGHGVDGITDDLAKHIPLGKSPGLCVDPGIGNAGVQERLRVVRVHDGVVPAVAQPVALSPQHPVCNVVKGTAP